MSDLDWRCIVTFFATLLQGRLIGSPLVVLLWKRVVDHIVDVEPNDLAGAHVSEDRPTVQRAHYLLAIRMSEGYPHALWPGMKSDVIHLVKYGRESGCG